MIKKILIAILLIFLIPVNSFSKAPPLGTGSLVPANIMIMLDNSGSMAWDLGGNQLTSGTFLKNPTDIETDSKGNVYVLQDYWTYNSDTRKNYRIHKFNSDGELQSQFLEHGGNWHRDRPCGKQYYQSKKFAIHNDQIYIVNQGYYSFHIDVLTLDGKCIRQGPRIDFRQTNYGPLRYLSIAVSDNYIFLGTSKCSGCYGSNWDDGFITILRRDNLREVKKVKGYGNWNQYNYWGAITDITLNSDYTKMLVTIHDGQGVCLHTISGSNISGCTNVGGRPYGRPNINPNHNWQRAWSHMNWCGRNCTGTTATGFHYNPMGAGFDSSGNIYIVEKAYHNVQKFNSSGTYLGKYGYGSYQANYNGGAFRSPEGLHVSSDDKIYVADTGNGMIRQISFNASNHEGSLTATFTAKAQSRMDIARKVIKRIVSNTELTSSANFGLMEWGHPYRSIRWHSAYRYDTWRYNYYGTRIRVPVTKDGARLIYKDIDNVYAGGGTYLAPALNIARNYFKSGYGGFPSPRVPGAKCQANYLIVISDGVWASHNQVKSYARDLKNQYEIKTFAVGFATSSFSSSTKQRYVDLAVEGGTVAPMYADNAAEMIAKLTDAIKQVVSGSLTFNNPAIMSDKQKGDYIYQSTFKYSKNTQWEGHLKKHKFDSKSGNLGATEWDAADKLNKKKSSDRSLWTTSIGTQSLNNFTTDYRNDLKTLLFPKGVYPTTQSAPTDTQVDNFINFIRGDDIYDEDGDNNTSESRHKLADIYHANVNVVGPVEGTASANDGSANYDKKDSYYRYQKEYDNFKIGNSCGEACNSRTEVVIAGSNAGILHAFKTLDGEELWGYIPPNIIGKLSAMITSKANASNPIYGIDGSATIKDIYFDDTPHDATDNPRWRTVLLSALGPGGHGYFAVDITNIKSPKHLFAIENDPFDNIVRHWNGDEQKREYPYSPGNPMAEQEYDYQKLGEAWSAPRIIRIKHNGNDKWVAVVGGGFNGATNPNYGSAVFVIDLENEGAILKRIDIEDTSTSNIINSIPSDLAVITADGTQKANYSGAMVYAADLEGKVTKINLTDRGTMYQTTTIFNAESTNENGRYIFTKPDATIKNSNFWLYFGTGDLQKLQTQNSNVANRLYGIKDKHFPDFQSINPPGDVSKCKKGGNCPQVNDLGWYINLDKSKKVTAEPTIDKNLVYFPVYEPKPAVNICDSGDAILYSVNSTCGNAIQRKLGKGVLSKVIVRDNILIIGISGEADKGINAKDNLISIKSTQKSLNKKITIEGWKENF
jgi:type IV pilus assembly protein PilY1